MHYSFLGMYMEVLKRMGHSLSAVQKVTAADKPWR